MSSKRPFKIVIVGGGITGLTLANMLDKFDIDYVVLEGREEIHPPLGAAIGLMPNGSFIMEQLGCYEAIRSAAPNSEIEDSHVRDSDGRPVVSLKHMMYHQARRHGYPMHFFDRQLFLKVLYAQVKHKERILTGKKVDRLEFLEDGARVLTKDGESYTGDIVIGGDGIHSVIRKILRKSSTRFDQTEEDKVPCYYQCSFGIAQNVDGWPASEQCFTTGRGKSFLVISGPGGRCYWFLFVKYPKPLYGKDIPRYTKEDEEKFVQENSHLLLCEGLSFAQVYAKRVQSALTPLHEVVFKQWYHDRVLLIGDSAHKPNPIGGMGGNAAIETAAEFINALIDTRAKRPGNSLDGLTQDEITAIFKHVQKSRHARAEFIVDGSHKLQAVVAMENPLLATFALRVLIPLAGQHNFFRDLSYRIVGASRLKHLDIPSRPRALPFNHELPSRPLQGFFAGFVRLLFLAGFAALVYLAETTPYEELVSRCQLLLHLKKATPAYFITSMLSPLVIYNIEGARIGRHGSPLALPIVFVADMLYRGVGRSALTYALVYVMHSALVTVDRAVPIEMARSLAPAAVAGFVLPLAWLVQSGPSMAEWQVWAPMLAFTFYALLASFKLVLNMLSRDNSDPEKHVEWYITSDVSPLRVGCLIAFAVQALAHITAAAPSFGLAHLIPQGIWSNFIAPTAALPASESGLMWLMVAAFAHSLYLIWEQRQSGYVSTVGAFRAAIALCLGSVIVGPGASWVAVYRWREKTISSLST